MFPYLTLSHLPHNIYRCHFKGLLQTTKHAITISSQQSIDFLFQVTAIPRQPILSQDNTLSAVHFVRHDLLLIHILTYFINPLTSINYSAFSLAFTLTHFLPYHTPIAILTTLVYRIFKSRYVPHTSLVSLT